MEPIRTSSGCIDGSAMIAAGRGAELSEPRDCLSLTLAACWLSRQSYIDPYWATQALNRYGLPTTQDYIAKVLDMYRQKFYTPDAWTVSD
jgi:hypothetical protein